MAEQPKLRTALYLRVSTEEQTVANQEQDLRAICAQKGWTIVATFSDVEGGGVPTRSGLSDLLAAAARREFDVVCSVELSRLSRGGIGATFSILNQLKSNGVGFFSAREAWASTVDGPFRDLLFAILSWASQQERLLISERTKSALRRRKNLGLPLGRPKGSKDSRPRERRMQKRPAWEMGERNKKDPRQ